MKAFITGLLKNLAHYLKNLAHPAGFIGLIIALVIPALIWFLGRPTGGHKEIIRLLDLNLPLPLFCLQLLAAIVLFFLLNKDFREWFKGILPAKSFCIITAVFAVAVAIFAGTQIEARHRVQSDESVFMSVAQNMYYNHESGTCNQGIFDNGNLKCVSTSNSFKTKGLAFLYYLGMHFFGTDLHWIFKTRQPLLAFLAALLMALQPTVLFQFRAMSVEPLYIFLSALSLFIFKWAYDRNTVYHWVLLALCLAFFAQTRQETIFCIFAFIIFALPKVLDKKDYKAPAFFATFSLFSVPALLTISYYQGFGFQGGEFDAHWHFWEDLAKNWTEMTKPLKENGELENPFLTYFNYLFAIGAVYLVFRAIYDATKGSKFYLWTLVFLALYHVQTYMILENVSGDFTIQINQRYSLVMLPSMAFIGALPIAHAIEYFAGSFDYKNRTKLAFTGMLITALAFSAWTAHYKDDFNKNIMYNRNHLTIEEYEILSWLKEQPKKERMFIYGRPWHFIGYGVSSIHYDRARQMSTLDLKKLIDKYKGEVYYIRGLDCWDSHTYHKKAVEHRIATTCDVFERDMDLEGVKNILITNNYWVQIAKFNGRKEFNPQNIIAVSDLELRAGSEDSTKQSLFYRFNLNETAAVANQWDYTILFDGDTIAHSAYSNGIYLRQECEGESANKPALVYNNSIVISNSPTNSTAGIQVNNDTRNVALYYNTVRVAGSAGYCFYNANFKAENLGAKASTARLCNVAIAALKKVRKVAADAFARSSRFDNMSDIEHLAELAKPFVSLGNQTGEGWFLTGEMLELIHNHVPNIVCTQPFACLPNHVVGKGVIKELRHSFPDANIVAIDYDPGASEVNQLNRIKLMLATAQKNLAAKEQGK